MFISGRSCAKGSLLSVFPRRETEAESNKDLRGVGLFTLITLIYKIIFAVISYLNHWSFKDIKYIVIQITESIEIKWYDIQGC